MKITTTSSLILVLCVVAATCALSACTATRVAGPSPMQREQALRALAQKKNRWFHGATAKVAIGVDTAFAFRVVDTLLSRQAEDMFWLYPGAGFYFYDRDRIPEELRMRFRRALKAQSPYRGDTENHFLMYYIALYLYSQEWPDMRGDEWFNGKSSAENHAEAAEYLEHWIDETARFGVTEWDSPRYAYFYIGPLLILHDFAADTALARRAGMMIELHLADFATDNLNDAYCGAHSRDGDAVVTEPRAAETACYAQFYFGDSLGLVFPDLAFAALSRFRCPEIIRAIATDRSVPYAERETRRSRLKIRGVAGDRFTRVDKYTWMTQDYALGSIAGGIQGPIQQHTWDVTFAARRPNATIFGLHPHYSADDLGMFFPEESELMLATVAQTKGNYVNENKWLGGSPYEWVAQDSATLIALYRIPASAPFQHIDLFFPKSLDTIERDPSGWIFCRMEEAFVAIYPMSTDSTWIDEKTNWRLRLRSHPGAYDGYVVDCGSAGETDYELFKQRHRAAGSRPEWLAADLHDGTLRYRTPNGKILTASSDGLSRITLSVDGHATGDTTGRWLFDGPFVTSERGSGVIRLRHGSDERVLDFRR